MASVHHCDRHLHSVSFQQLLISNKSRKIRCNFVYVSRKQRILNHSEMEKKYQCLSNESIYGSGQAIWCCSFDLFFHSKNEHWRVSAEYVLFKWKWQISDNNKDQVLILFAFFPFSCDADLHFFFSFLKNHCQRKYFTTNSRFKQKKGRKSKFGIY